MTSPRSVEWKSEQCRSFLLQLNEGGIWRVSGIVEAILGIDVG
jgi:hypothetical protein